MIIHKAVGIYLSWLGIVGTMSLIVLMVLMEKNKKKTIYKVVQIILGVIIFNSYTVIGFLIAHEKIHPAYFLIIPVISYIPYKILEYIHKYLKKESLI